MIDVSRPSVRISLAFVVSVSLHVAASAQMTERVSVSSQGVQADGVSQRPAISADGRFVAFESVADNLVLNDANQHSDVFVHDRQSGATELVSVSTSGAQGNMDSGHASISADGRFVAFQSAASNLVPLDTNQCLDVFVHDRLLGTTERVSIDSAGVEGDNHSTLPSISADGRLVAFQSSADNFVAGDTNAAFDIFVHDRQTGVTRCASVTPGGVPGDLDSSSASISADGRFVVFFSLSDDLVLPSHSGGHVFVYDVLLHTNARMDVNPAGELANSGSTDPSISADGRYVAFDSSATNLDPAATTGLYEVFVHDRLTGSVERVSATYAGGQANSSSVCVAISGNGLSVLFRTVANNVVPNDSNGAQDLFVHERTTGWTGRMSVSTQGQQSNDWTWDGSPSTDSHFVAFSSSASNLVTSDTNAVEDIFVRTRRTEPMLSTPFCFGDGTGAACPCGNESPAHQSAGCLNSLGSAGTLTGSGSPSIVSDTFVLEGSGMTNGSVLYFQGTIALNGGGVQFGDGLRCVGGALIRLGTHANVGGISRHPAVGGPAISVTGVDFVGAVRMYQAWYRNAASFCQPATFNLTNGVRATWMP